MQFYFARFEEQRKRTSSSMAFSSGVRGHSVCGFSFFPDSQYISLKPTKFVSFRKFPMSSSSAEFLSGRNPSSDRSKQPSADELRVSLLFALASQAASQSQRFIQGLASEAVKYVNPRRFEVNSLEEAFMSVPDLETVSFRVIRRERSYEIREVQSYYVAETTMPGDTGFDFYGSSQAFNTLAAYLFGKNAKSDEMAMTTPVISQQAQFDGEKMEMTTPVFTRKAPERSKWVMSFVMPSKYGTDLPLPVDTSVRIKQIPEKVVAVAVFSGLVTNGEVEQREAKLRAALSKDPLVRIKENASVEVAQYNPPFTLPFMRRNEISLEVELVKDLTS